MVKVKEEVKIEAARIQALEQENAVLRNKLETETRLREEQGKILGGDLSNEMRLIRQKGRSTAGTIQVQEINDHKNVSLWEKDGSRIGPMHPDNAIQTLNRFADLGIILSATKPTEAQVEAYKQTAEYKKLAKQEEARRATKEKSRRSGQVEKLSAEIAKMSGTTVDAINRILQQHEVKK